MTKKKITQDDYIKAVKKAKTYAQREYNKGCECRFGYTIVQPIIFE